jgi:hypothetical protein
MPTRHVAADEPIARVEEAETGTRRSGLEVPETSFIADFPPPIYSVMASIVIYKRERERQSPSRGRATPLGLLAV